MVGVLFLLVLATFSLAAYREVREALTGVLETRLETAGGRLREALEVSPPRQLGALAALGRHPAVAAFLRQPAGGQTDGEEATALAALDSARLAVPDRRVMIARSRGGATLLSGDPEATRFLSDDMAGAGVGPLVASGETVGFEVSNLVIVDGDTLGILTEARVANETEQNAALIAGLIGEDASFRVGNASGDVWTDLVGVADGPPTPVPLGRVVRFEREGGRAVFGIAQPVAGTPWIQWVDLPASGVSAPLGAFVRRIAVPGALLVVTGGFGAWLLGRRLTRPLARLTGAAEAVAQGDYSRRIGSARKDEIGRLGDAFDTMAEKVAEASHRLEERVAARTAELERVLTDLEDAQEELVRKERLALLGELAGGVGHELRNPLGVMTNAVFYLEAVLRDRSSDVDDYLGILRKQIHTSEKIVSDLLDFARVKPPQRRSTRLDVLADEQVDRAAPPATVEVRRDFPAELPPASVDPGQIGQVVLNLVTNAVQAMQPEGGVLTLRGRANGERVFLEVEDSGTGMDAATLEKVFEPLFTTRAKGIGLGLSVSRSLVEANGGSLDARSAPGRGSTFVLSLPVTGAPA